MSCQLINSETSEVVFTGSEKECADFIKNYETGKPVLTFIPEPTI